MTEYYLKEEGRSEIERLDVDTLEDAKEEASEMATFDAGSQYIYTDRNWLETEPVSVSTFSQTGRFFAWSDWEDLN